MAKVQYGGGVTQFRGAIGGVVFNKNRNGSYVKLNTLPIKGRSQAQSVVKSLFTISTQLWRSLSISARQSWNDNAHLYPYINNLGVSCSFSGFQLYCKFAMQLLQTGTNSADCLVNLGIPIGSNSIFSINSVDQTFSEIHCVIQTYSGFITIVPDFSKVSIYATLPTGVGTKSPNPSFWRLIYVANPLEDLEHINLRANYLKVFGTTYPSPSGQFIGAKIFSLITPEISPMNFSKITFV